MRVASSTDRCIGRGVRVVLLGGFAVYVVTAIWVWCVCHMIISIYLSGPRSSDGYSPPNSSVSQLRVLGAEELCGHAAAGARAHRI